MSKQEEEKSKEMAKEIKEKLQRAGFDPEVSVKNTSVYISVEGDLEQIVELLIETKGDKNE
tara:strand:- start:60 stop:242 length:183 start_codon:yes stop_codon:yes gene_type:complete